MPDWKRVKIDFKTEKLGSHIEPIKNRVSDLKLVKPTVYGVSNVEGITVTGKEASKDLSDYIVLEDNCFAFNPYRINIGSIGINEANLKGCVSPAYVVFKTKDTMNPKFLFRYLKSNYGNHLINWYGNKGGVRNALRYDDLEQIDIPIVPRKKQDEIVVKLDEQSKTIEALLNENTKQELIINKLRQAILQDAIEGKLTADWRKENPVRKGDPNYDAQALLDKIKEEKQKLIKEGKIRKEKPLEPIKPEEIPFELPKGWVWCRFEEIANIMTNLVDSFKHGSAVHVAPDNIEKFTGKLLHCNTVKEDKVISPNHLFEPGMILYSKVRPRLRKVVKVGFSGLCSADMYPIKAFINIDYLAHVMLSDYFNEQVFIFDNRVKMPKINQVQLNSIKIPLPSLFEQVEITKKTDNLFRMISELTLTISNNNRNIENISDSLLNGIFQ